MKNAQPRWCSPKLSTVTTVGGMSKLSCASIFKKSEKKG